MQRCFQNRPEALPPFWFAGTIDKALVRVAKYGEGWLPGGLTPEEYVRSGAFIRKTAKEEFDREMSELKVTNQIYVSIDNSRQKRMLWQRY